MKLKYSETGQAITVKPDMAPMYQTQGWVEVPTSKKSSESAKGSK